MVEKKEKKTKTKTKTKKVHKNDDTHDDHHSHARRAKSHSQKKKLVDTGSKVVVSGGAEKNEEEKEVEEPTTVNARTPVTGREDKAALPPSSSSPIQKQTIGHHGRPSVTTHNVSSFRDQRALMSSIAHQEQTKEDSATDFQISEELQQSPGAVHVVPGISTSQNSQTHTGSARQESDDDEIDPTDQDRDRDDQPQQRQQEDQATSQVETLVTAHLVEEYNDNNDRQNQEQQASVDEKVVVEAKVVNLEKYVVGILVAVVVVGVAVAVGVVLSVNRPSDSGSSSPPTHAPSESMSPSEAPSQPPTSILDSELATLDKFFDSGTTPDTNVTRINAGKFFLFVFKLLINLMVIRLDRSICSLFLLTATYSLLSSFLFLGCRSFFH